MSEHEIKEIADELDLRLKGIKGMDELLDFLCHEYAKAEYNYNQKIEKNIPSKDAKGIGGNISGKIDADPKEIERYAVLVDLIRQRITNITMYKNGWAYAHEGGGWYEMDYEQGDSAIWY